MGSPDNSAPRRPPNIPAEARWDPGKLPGFEWKLGDVDEEGRRHGRVRSWTRAGVLHADTDYVHGVIHGKNINYHPDGTIASEADWVSGVIMDSVYYRSEHPTTEPFAQAADNVWSVRYYTRDGKTNYTIRYFSRDGTECGPDGNPLPPRAAGVSPDARWFPDMRRWVEGEIERGTNTQVGRWRWWSQEGVLRHEELRDARGEAVTIAQYEADGALHKQTTRSEAGEERDYYFDDGKLSTRYRSDRDGHEIYKGSWLRDGSLDEEIVRVYECDHLASVTERGPGGAVRFEARREGPAMACIVYGDDGKTISATGLVEDGQLRGVWRVFESSGALRREIDTTLQGIEHDVTGDGLEWALGEALYRLDEPALATPEQLAGIDDEPWADTPGCHDERVEEFPRLVRALIAPDPLVRTYALATIDGEIEHQGSIYPATARVLPYLARLLSHPRADVSALLAVIRTVGEVTLPCIEQVGLLDPASEERITFEGTARAVTEAWPNVYERFASAGLPDRMQILGIAKYASGAHAQLLEIARREPDPGMRACAIDTLTSLPDADAADVTPCLRDKDPLVRAAAAIALGCTKGPAAPREVIAALDEAIRGWREIATRFAALPYTDGHVLCCCALAAGAIRTPDARSLAQILCASLELVDPVSATAYGRGLLALALGTGDRPFAKRFVEILATLAASKQFWVLDVNAREVLDRWRLPRERSDLLALVEELERAPDAEVRLHARLRPR